MVDALERLGRLWKDGILTDEEFAAQKRRVLQAPAAGGASADAPQPVDADPAAAPDAPPEAEPDTEVQLEAEPKAEPEEAQPAKARAKLTTILLGAVAALALAGGVAVIVFWLASPGEHEASAQAAPTHEAAEEAHAPTAEPAPEPEALIDATDNAQDPEAAEAFADADIPLPLNLRLRCTFRGAAVSVSACLYGDLKAPHPTLSGTFKLTSHGRTILFGQERLLTAFRGLSVTYSLTPDFRAEIQSSSDDATTLGVEVMRGDETVYSNGFSRRDGAVLDSASLSL